MAGHGHRTPGQPHTLLAVAIEEMMHLDTVNGLSVELGSSPNLARQDLPYEPRIYPFQLAFEPLSPKSLAKYILAEAPGNLEATDPTLFAELTLVSESRVKINDVGSIYATIRRELKNYGERSGWARWQFWDGELENIQHEGEVDHYEFFLSVYRERISSFRGNRISGPIPTAMHTHP